MPPEINKNDISFSAFLVAKMKERGVSLRKLSELSGISVQHLAALTRGELTALPPAPYLHGYLVKLGQILGFDPAEWWEVVRRSGGVRRSGSSDALPKNRFMRKSYRRLIVGGAILGVIIIYVIVRLSSILGVPQITVLEPAEDGATAVSDVYVLRGKVKLADRILVNGEAADLTPEGEWQKRVVLESGRNTFEIRAQKLLGRSASVMRYITFNPITTTTEPVVLPEPEITTSSPATMEAAE